MSSKSGYWNPYVVGFAMGLTLLASFFLTGRGIGASGAMKRLSGVVLHSIDPTFAEENKNTGKYFKNPKRSPLNHWLFFLFIGAGVGGLIGVLTGKRFKIETIRGPRITKESRWVLAIFGGILSGFAAQIGRGCMSGQVLTGGSQLALGSWVFMIAVFISAYGLAYFVRKEWI